MSERTLTKDQFGCLLISLAAARDATLIASVAADLKFSDQSSYVLEALQRVAADAGLELVERHSAPAVDQVSRLPIDQKSNEPAAADPAAADFPNGIVNR